MKYLKSYKESNNQIICSNCGWTWKAENGDDRKHLCHKCGYDSKLNRYDEEAFKKWKKENK